MARSDGYFKPGHKRLGGRESGVKARAARALEIVEKSGVDPLQVLIELCKDNNKVFRLQAAKEVCKYIYPQFKNIEEEAPEIISQFANLTDAEKLEKAQLAVRLLEERLKK